MQTRTSEPAAKREADERARKAFPANAGWLRWFQFAYAPEPNPTRPRISATGRTLLQATARGARELFEEDVPAPNASWNWAVMTGTIRFPIPSRRPFNQPKTLWLRRPFGRLVPILIRTRRARLCSTRSLPTTSSASLRRARSALATKFRKPQRTGHWRRTFEGASSGLGKGRR